MKYLDQKKGFLGYDASFKIKNKVVIIPFGLEKTVSYGGGTKNGPKEIIKASHQVELFDEEVDCEPCKKIGIKTLKPVKIHSNIKKALEKISEINQKVLNEKLFPMTLVENILLHQDVFCLLQKGIKNFVYYTLMRTLILEKVITVIDILTLLQLKDVLIIKMYQ